MTAVVTVETLLLVLLTLLVAGLLRSHAEILRLLNSLERTERASELPSDENAGGVREAMEIAGTTIGGEGVRVAVPSPGSRLLLAFLTSGCSSCRSIWRALGDHPAVPGNADLMVITKDRDTESVSRLRKMRAAAVPVVMSTEAWEAYRVPASPYFVFLEGKDVRGEGSADSWQAALTFLEDALEEAEYERDSPALGPSGVEGGSPRRDAADDRKDRPAEQVEVG